MGSEPGRHSKANVTGGEEEKELGCLPVYGQAAKPASGNRVLLGTTCFGVFVALSPPGAAHGGRPCTDTAGGLGAQQPAWATVPLRLEASLRGASSPHRRKWGREGRGVKSALVSHRGPCGRLGQPPPEGKHTPTSGNC